MNDTYTHNDSNIYYVVENIVGPIEQSLEYEQLTNDFNSQLSEHCNCGIECSFPTCKCLQKSYGPNYIMQWSNNQKTLSLNCKSFPIFECNEYCLCSKNCCNRLVQKGPSNGLVIKPCDKGLGLFTSIFISKGSFVCEYAGELLTKSQATARHQSNVIHNKMNYIFCLKEHYFNSVVETFVDPSVFGNIGRYFNHSCEPNCHIVPVRCDSPLPKLAVFAISDILPEQELTYHYGCDSNDVEHSHRIKCLCKSKKCCGLIPYYKY